MKRKIGFVAVLLLVLSVLFVSCGKSGSKASVSGEYRYETAQDEDYYDRGYAEPEVYQMDMAPAEAALSPQSMKTVKKVSYAGSAKAMGTANDSGNGSALLNDNIRDLNLKLIYRANISVQTLVFDDTYNALCDLVNGYGGYFESAYKYNGSMDDKTHPYGNYTIRIPSEKYAEFVNRIGDTSHLVNIEQSVEDVSLSYADIEQHLKTLNTKHERLITLLASAKDMKDIISLENALSDCESELDRYSSKKVKYDSLIGFSTIRLNLQEVERLEPPVPEKPLTYGQKLVKAIKRGFNNFTDSVANFIIWFFSHILGIVFWVAVVVLVCVFIRKRKKARALKKERKAQEDD